MDNEYMDNENYEESSFTFKGFWALIKKSWFRMVVFGLIAAIVMCIFSAIFITTTRTSVETASTIIIYNYSGAEKGLDPFGKPLDTGKIKSPSVIYSAITALNKSGANIDMNKQGEIINNLNVTGLVPPEIIAKIKALEKLAETDPNAFAELTNFEYHCFQFRITLNNFRDIGLSNDVTSKLLDEIVKQYTEDFKNEYNNNPLLGAKVGIINDLTDPDIITKYGYDYLEFYDVYFHQYNEIIEYLNQKVEQDPLYISKTQDKKFSSFIRPLEHILKVDLINYETFVIQNAITLDHAFLKQSLAAKLKEYTLAITESEANVVTLEKLIADYTKTEIKIPDGNGGFITISGDSKKKDELVDKLYEVEKSINQLNTKKDKLDTRIKAFADGNQSNNTEANQLIALKMLSTLSNGLKTNVDSLNSFVNEYLESKLLNNAVTVTQPSVITNATTNKFKQALFASAVVCILAVVAAIITTSVIEKKKAKKLEENNNEATPIV